MQLSGSRRTDDDLLEGSGDAPTAAARLKQRTMARPAGDGTVDEPAGDGTVDEPAVRALMLASRAFVGLTLRTLAAAAVDVTLPQFRTLVVLAVRGPQRSSDIAEELGVNPSTGTRMCERLDRKGLVFRMPDPGDRRVVRLGLTRAGQEVVDRVLTARRAELARLVAATAGRWQPAVTDALNAFAAAAGEAGDPDWWLGWSADPADSDDAGTAGDRL